MNDIMKAIEILQSVRDMLTARHRFLEPFGDLPEEIEQLQEVIAMLSPLQDEPADEQDQWPEPPPPIKGAWQSCEHGIDAEDGDWMLLAWPHGKLGWQYAAAQVSCDVDATDKSESIELLDWDGNEIDLEPSNFYVRIGP